MCSWLKVGNVNGVEGVADYKREKLEKKTVTYSCFDFYMFLYASFVLPWQLPPRDKISVTYK
jgi:hypothetical protein